MRFEFDGFELDLEKRELFDAGNEIIIEPKVFDLLTYMVLNRDRMLSKEELINAVWDGRFISDSAVSTTIKFARKAVGDNGRDQHTIKTVFGRGFRFVKDPLVLESSDQGTVTSNKPVQKVNIPPVSNVPRRQGPFWGRDEEFVKLQNLVREKALVSIVGPGGAGKSALSMEIGRWAQDHFSGGVWFCELATANEAQLESVILGTLDRSAGAGPVNAARIAERIGEAPTLLILDNCEHVIDAVARLTDELIQLLPALMLLTTSREELDVLGENIVRIGGLDFGSADAPAVRLFQSRAAEVSNFVDNDENKETIRKITKRLEGLPLAIELAAPRLASYSPVELLEALDDQLSVLASRRRHSAARHSRMDDTITWSFDLLKENERNVLLSLGVFAGAFTMEAAIAVCGPFQAREAIHRLVQQSVVTFLPSDGEEASRFKLLEPIRQFCMRQLDDTRLVELTQCHAEWYAGHTIDLAHKMRGPGETTASHELTAEWSDVGRALEWGRQNNSPKIAIDPLLALHIHLLWQLRIEGFSWLESGVNSCGLSEDRQPQVDLLRAMGCWSAGELEQSEQLLEASVKGGGETTATAYFRFYQAFAREDFAGVHAAAEAAWVKAEASDDIAWQTTAAAFRIIGRTMVNPNDEMLDGLFQDLDRRLNQYRWPSGECGALLAMLTYEFMTGDAASGTAIRNELDRVADACNAPWFKITASGVGAQDRDDVQDAASKVQRSAQNLRMAVASGDLMQLPTLIRFAAMELWEVGEVEASAKIIGLVPKVRGLGEKGSMAPGYDQTVKMVREALPIERLKELLRIGSHLSLEEAVVVLESALENNRSDDL
ncbi:winged helix-turn-helix domain-containing protein [Lentilitoribacter sp. EG35]|uniref:winged helix-turn-helix domain-containing protein n=1 Tax=Lentilitoribacter sp. EG35 TaxID=3234192 RepID=UPI0034614AA7